jgi:ABC-2 type transport system permease protein
MSANTVFNLVDERGWRRGLGNMTKGQLSGWFKSSRWWRHSLIWLACVNVILFFATIGFKRAAADAAAAGEPPPDFETLMLYGIFGGMFVAFGVMIIMQGVIVGEKKSGTAAWILSKPVTRTSFVVSRLVGNTLGILVTAVLLPGVVAFITVGTLTPDGWPVLLNFLAGWAVLAVSMFFWLTLTLVAGTFFDSVGGVIAVPLATYFAMWLLPGYLPFLLYISPVLLTVRGSDAYPAVAESLMYGESPYSWLPLIVALVLSIVFSVVAIWRFNRQEF